MRISKKPFAFMMLCLLLLCGIACAEESAAVTVYPQPEGIEASEHYAVTVNGLDSFCYITRRSSRIAGDPQTASFTSFAFEGGAITVKVSVLDGTAIEDVVVRPTDLGIQPTVKGSEITFTIDEPAYISVEINGDTTHKCFIFADPPEEEVPDPDDETVWYFAPGVYDIGHVGVPEGKNTMYIAGGAYVKGCITDRFSKRGEFKIIGRGIFSGEDFPNEDLGHLIQVKYASRFTIDGPILLDSNSFHLNIFGTKATAESPNIVHHLKEISWVPYTDGFHIDKYIDVADVFIYNYDDALDISQYSLGGTIKNCVIWNNNYGSALLLGWVGVRETGNVTVENIDVIHFNENDTEAANTAVIMANHGERGIISNVYVHDLHVENFDGKVHRLFSIQLNKSAWSAADSDMGSISNLHFSDIRVDDSLSSNLVQGFDAEHTVSDVLFENLVVEGETIGSIREIKVLRNEYTKSVKVIHSFVRNGSFEQGSDGWVFSGNAKSIDLYQTGNQENNVWNGHCVGLHETENGEQARTYQILEDLSDGTYTMTAYVKTGGSLSEAQMYALSDGTEYTCTLSPSDAFAKVTLEGIEIKNGTCEIGFVSNSAGQATLSFDQVTVVKK